MFRRILAGAGAALALFHVWLFAGQAIEGQLADPALAARWLVAALLALALLRLHRSGAPLFRGRKAVAIWLLAALLHGPAVGHRLEALESPAIPEAAAMVGQIAVAAAAAVALLLLLWISRAPRAIRAAFARVPRRAAAVAGLPPGAFHRFAPRPPPSV